MPFADRPIYDAAAPWKAADVWPAKWIHPAADWATPWVAVFRCVFEILKRLKDRLHVTADERYELYLNGQFLGRGSERGDRGNWFYETYALDLKPGTHVLTTRVWALGSLAPWAQRTVKPGLLCCPENPSLIPLLATGEANWDVRRLAGYSFSSADQVMGTAMGGGPCEHVDFSQMPADDDAIAGKAWGAVRTGAGGNNGFYLQTLQAVPWLRPATLPVQARGRWKKFAIARSEANDDSHADWQGLLRKGVAMTIPARTRRVLWIDLTDYVCAYPELGWSGGKGSRISFGWAEALRSADGKKQRFASGDEDQTFRAGHDCVLSDGRSDAQWRSLWWRCGRFVELVVETGDAPLVLESLVFEETRYPLEAGVVWRAPDPRLGRVLDVCLRTAQMCAHETYMDCPYYEQLMYGGDTRIQCLITYLLTKDDRLPIKAITTLDASRMNPSGWTADAYPSSDGKVIPPFSLWWIAIVHDHARWRGNSELVARSLPGVRAILEKWHALVDGDRGIVAAPLGWNFVDSHFYGGVPPGAEPGGFNASLQLQYILALGQAAGLEDYAGEPELKRLHERRRREAVRAFRANFWKGDAGLVAEDLSGTVFTEHAQCLSLLTGIMTAAERRRVWKTLEAENSLKKVSAYFSHYLFEAALDAGKIELFRQRLAPWFASLDEGFKTTPDTFGSTRSDCHAWSAHPLYHYITGVLGIQPGGYGFSTVRIVPRLDTLSEMSGGVMHPAGPIRVRYVTASKGWTAEVELPDGLTGELIHGGSTHRLRGGRQTLRLK